MKIAYILPVNMKNYGYSKENFINTHFSVDIAKEAAQKKHEVSLHVFWDKKDLYQENNLTIYFYPLSLQKIFNSGFAEISHDLLKTTFSSDTIIHFHEPNRVFYAIFALKNKNKIIVEHHGSGINNPFPYPSRFSIPFEIFRRFFLAKYLRKTNFVIVHNKDAKKNFESYLVNKEQIILAPNGIQPKRYTIENRLEAKRDLLMNNKIVLLFIGRIHKGKGLLELIAAYKNLKGTNPHLELILLGPLHDVSLKETVKPYWKGFKNPQELQRWLSAADIFCLPSYTEAFGIVLLEALFYNLPIITTNTGGPKEFVPAKNALFIPPRDTVALQNAIQKMLNEPFRKKKSLQGRELVLKKYTWEKIFLQYEKLYMEASKK